jgi:Flp pilus assembly protein TadG
MSRIARSARKLARNRSGAAVAEFAMIALALFALVVFLVEGSFQLLTEAMLHHGLREATRFGITGQAYPPSMSAHPPASREAAIAEIISSSALGLIDPSNLSVTLTSYTAFNTVGTSGQGVSGAGGSGAIVQYEVAYYQPWLLLGSNYLPAESTGLSGIVHVLSAVVKNENFPAP